VFAAVKTCSVIRLFDAAKPSKPFSVNAQEFAQLKDRYPDEVILGEKLKSLKRQGGLDPESPVGFLVAALQTFT
jgi:hypothetical protein